ncbi:MULTISPECIES: hypothetical protein [unclassified Chelatococcus]|uniref:hypothetical protein n=1 Tax=unclassified Chelatococcus TaxID=2638111 RepID=UPI001BCE3C03|nr:MULTISPECIES: hypothetical protein [unclassified Chelatococcus]MBS7699146.1 hypothetical protein [Chelatococcus sp. YT9]MBX3554927.1 hypothetical protein [Chelatococcus sp.]
MKILLIAALDAAAAIANIRICPSPPGGRRTSVADRYLKAAGVDGRATDRRRAATA